MTRRQTLLELAKFLWWLLPKEMRKTLITIAAGVAMVVVAIALAEMGR